MESAPAASTIADNSDGTSYVQQALAIYHSASEPPQAAFGCYKHREWRSRGGDDHPSRRNPKASWRPFNSTGTNNLRAC
jgi:hypothetical protein